MAKNSEIFKYDPHISTWLYGYGNDVLYVKSKLRFKPSEKKSDYTESAAKIKEVFQSHVERLVKKSNALDNRFLCSIEFSDGSLSVSKWSRAKFDIYVKPLDKKCDGIDELMAISQKINIILTRSFAREGFILMPRDAGG